MDQVPCLPRTFIACLFAILLASAACSSASAPTAAPAGSPAASAAPSAGGGTVTTEDEALAAVVAAEPRFAGITKRDPDMIGQSSWYEIKPASGVGAFVVTISVGWGDCPSGCIENHTWVYAVAPDGTVSLQSQGGSEVPPEAWPSPAAGGAAQTGTGLHITAMAGPTCPVEQPGDPACAPQPVPNVSVVIMDGNGAILDRIVLNASGTGVITLDPGDYIVRAEGVEGFMSGPEPQRATVVDGRMTQVDLQFDTGIR
jgi:hypothetical protein